MSDFAVTVTIGGTPLPFGAANVRFTTAAPGDSSTCDFNLAVDELSGPLSELSSILHWGTDLAISAGPGERLWRGIISRVIPNMLNGIISVQGVGYWGESKDVLFQYAHTQTGYANWQEGSAFLGATNHEAYKCLTNKMARDKYSRLYITPAPATYSSLEGFWYYLPLEQTALGTETFSGYIRYAMVGNTRLRLSTWDSSGANTDLLIVEGPSTQTGVAFSYTLPAGAQYVAVRFMRNTGVYSPDIGVDYVKITDPVITYVDVSDPTNVVKDIVTNLGSQLGWIYHAPNVSPSPGGVTVSSLMFDQPVSLPEMLETINGYVDFNYGLDIDKKFYWLAKDTTQIAARIVGDAAIQDNLQWDFTDLYNEVYVRYTDSNQLETYLFMENTSPENYLNQWGKRRTGSIWMNDSQSDTEAENTANAYLDAHLFAKPNGTIVLPLEDYYYLRAGMFIQYLGGPYGQQTLTVQETEVDVDEGTITLTLSDLPGGPRTVLRRRRIQRWHKVGTA